MSSILSEERQEMILNLLEENEIVKLSTLINVLNTSESSIRRDLITLEKQNLLQRVHGGARKIKKSSEEQSYNEKSFKNIQEKEVIAKFAANLVAENETIFLDAGTSTYEMIKYLKGKNIFVVTNGLNHINALSSEGINCYIIGGKIKLSTKAVTGADAVKCLSKFVFDKVFLGTNAIDKKFGCTTPDPEEAELKRTASEQGKKNYVLADKSKFYSVSNVKFLELDNTTIITDDLDAANNFSNIARVEVASL